jgi:hypothetical protein
MSEILDFFPGAYRGRGASISDLKTHRLCQASARAVPQEDSKGEGSRGYAVEPTSLAAHPYHLRPPELRTISLNGWGRGYG